MELDRACSVDSTLGHDTRKRGRARPASFERAFGRDRPLIDFGCGNGTQTRFLARKFPNVIGVDVSETAIEAARATTLGDGPRYEVLDGTRDAAVAALAKRLGDANVYMRTVLHQMRPSITRRW